MIGFAMLIGVVVNNAILLVQQAINFTRPGHGFDEGDEAPLPHLDAIAESVRTRVRPIFMTTFTTIGGGLPLVLAPGAGSEMYRGLGAVVVGGLLVSTVFTLLLVPLVLSVVVQMSQGARTLLTSASAPGPHALPAPAPAPRANGEHTGASDKDHRERKTKTVEA